VLRRRRPEAGCTGGALSGNSARPGRATRLGLLSPIPLLPRVAARALTASRHPDTIGLLLGNRELRAAGVLNIRSR